MPNIQNFPKWLNYDNDERLLSPEEMPDALNVRGVSGDAGKSNILKSTNGNTLKAYALPSGDNTVVGTVTHEENNDLYYFVYNSLGSHSIVKYNSSTNTSIKVLENSVLSFSLSFVVQGWAIRKEGGDVLLGWTDKNVPPRRINVQKAVLHSLGNYTSGYPIELSNGTYAEREALIDAVKHPPLNKPTFEFDTDTNVSVNNIGGDAYQFQYRYIYDDGDVSAYSPISDVAISEYYLSNSVYVNTQQDLNNNIINVIVDSGLAIVDKVQVIFRKGNIGDWKVLGSFDNTPSQPTQSFRFDNASNYILADSVAALMPYSDVPILAKSTCFVGSRVGYGNYTQGYDNVEEVGEEGKVTFKPKYWARPDYIANIPLSATNSTSGAVLTARINIGSYTPNVGNTIFISLSIQIIMSEFASGDYRGSYSGIVFTQYVVKQGDSLTDVGEAILLSLSGKNFGSLYVDSGSFFNTSTNNINLRILATPYSINVSSLDIISSTPIFSNDSFYINSTLTTSSSSFKAGSQAPIGIVYYDRVNRSTTVQKPYENAYVKFFSERTGEIQGLGAVEIHNRIGITPPLFATHYKLLYQGSTIDNFIQYTCLKAYHSTGVNGGSQFVNNVIYLSMRSLSGAPDSYIKRYGANISYSYVKGDRLRVISYYNIDESERVYQTGYLDFNILGYEIFDASNSPFYNDSSGITQYQTTGYFLIIEDSKINGWQVSDLASTNNWYDNTSGEGCFFEIYRPKRNVVGESPYYEIGVEQPIIDAGLSTRRHGGNVRNQGDNINYNVSSAFNQANGYNYILISDSVVSFENIKIVVGDRVILHGQTKSIEVIDVQPDPTSGTRVYLNEETIVYGPAVTLDTSSLYAANKTVNGDVWVKPRILRTNNDPSIYGSYIDIVEDYYANDFTDSNSWSKGRANAFIENNRQVDRIQSITYSEPFLTSTNYNGLSTFNPSLSPYKDLENSFGSIQVLATRGDDIICYQEDRVSRLLVNKSILYSGDGASSTITQSTNILSPPEYYGYDGGIGLNPEGFAKNDNVHYFPSIKKGKVCRLSVDGVTPISDYNVRTKIYDISNLYLTNMNSVRIYGGYDRFNDEYFVSYPSVPLGSLVINGEEFPQQFSGITESETEIYIDVSIEASASAPKITFGSETRTFNNIIEEFSKWGKAFSTLSDLSEVNTLYVDLDEYTAQLQAEYLNSTATDIVYLKYTDSILLSGEYSISDGRITLLKAQPSGVLIGLLPASEIEYNTLSFSEKSNKWVSRWSFEPEFFAGVNFRFVSFKDGAMWIHNTNSSQGTFYGVFTPPSFSIMANGEPTVVKTYRALEIQGNNAWNCSLIETNLMSTSILKSLFSKKEGFWYSDVRGASVGSIDGNVVGLGVILSGSASVIVLDGYSRSDVNVSIGDVVYRNGFPMSTITGVNENGVNLSSTAGLNIGDFIYVVKNAMIDGDLVKGYYAKMTFVQDTNEYSEVFSVRSWVTPQMLSVGR